MAKSKEKAQANRAATITGDAAGSVLEDGASIASGLLVVSDLDKGENQVKAMKEKSGEYGKFSISADGSWTYVLNKNSKDVQELAEGETVTEKFVVTSKDGSATKTVEMTITGTNDVASIKGDTRATLTEDARKTTARGELEVKDQDHGQSSVQAVASQAGTYGSFSIDAKGHWTYVMNNSLAATQALAQGEKGTDSFVVWSKDGSASQTVTVTLKGVNDEATITGQDTGSVSEDAAPNTATGKLIVNDVDNGENTVVPITAQAGAYGSFSIVADGSWTYTLDNSLLAVQSLPAGVTLTESFVVWSNDSQLFTASDDHDSDNEDGDKEDGHDEKSESDHHAPSYKGASKVVTVTIVGTNDAAVISGSSTGAVTEELSLGTSGQLSVVDIDTGESSFQAQSNTVGTFGSLSIDTAGAWSYALNNGADNVQALASGETATDTFVVKSYDGTEQQITLTVTGTNDVATISGTSTGAVTEDTALSTGAALAVADVDHGEAVFQAQAGVAATYGSFDMAADGNWTYALNNTAANVQALAADEQVTDSFTATSFDGTASQLVTVTITGTNDDPTGSATAALAAGTEDSAYTVSASSLLAGFSDVDNGDVLSMSGLSASNGNVSDNGDGTFTITPTANFNGSVALNYNVVDGKGGSVAATQSYNLAAVNDAPTGVATAVLATGTEDTAYTVSVVNLLAGFSDVDTGDTLSVSDLSASNGSLVNNGNGTYTVTPTANFNGDVTLNYNVVDGKDGSVAATQSYNLAAVNDAPVLQGTMTEQLYTSSLSVWTPFLVNNGVWVTPTGASSGDSVPHTFVRQFTAAQDGNYVFQFAVDNEGSVMVDGVAIAGLYNNDWSHSTVQTVALTAGIHTVTMNALNWGGPAAFAMNITDPNNHEIWNTRTHLDPEPLILSYTENQAAIVVSSGLTLKDIDSSNMTQATVAVGTGFAAGDILGFANQNGITGVYDASTGVLSLSGTATQAQYQTALRSVTYSNSSDSPSTADRTINFTVDDGSGQFNLSNTVQSKIVVMAVNDAASIAGTSTGTVTEDTTLTTSGSLTVSDADAGEAVFVAQSAVAGTYGSFSIDANGQWTYTLDNSAADVQALAAGQAVSDTFSVTSQDGTGSTPVLVTLTGVNDAAVFGSPTSVSVTEDSNVVSGNLTAVGMLSISDIDDSQSAFSTFVSAAQGNLGSLTLAANGQYTYSVNNSLAAVQALNAGQTKVDSFTVASVDGTSKAINFTINGANEAATRSVVDFENLGSGGQIPDGYSGFNWDIVPNPSLNLNTLNGDTYGTSSGYQVGASGPGSIVAFTPAGLEPVSIVRTNGADFKFFGLNINAAWVNMGVTLTGSNNGALVGSTSLNINTTQVSNVAVDWGYIDKLIIDVTGQSQIVLDNFIYSL